MLKCCYAYRVCCFVEVANLFIFINGTFQHARLFLHTNIVPKGTCLAYKIKKNVSL